MACDDTHEVSADYHALHKDEIVAKLQTDSERGLSEAEARERLKRYGPNKLRQQEGPPAWQRFLHQFQDTLVILLMVAAVVSFVVWYLERDEAFPYDSVVILSIVLLNAILGFTQEERAEAALAALRRMSAPEAKVIRDGQERRIPADQVVPGDLLKIEEGDTIPADARLIEVVELRTLEASLTGESVPVRKSTEPVPASAPLADRRNMVFAGTTVAYGHGRAVVTATGMQTELGRIAGLLSQTKPEPTPLQRELDRVGKRLGGLVVMIALVVVGTLLLLQGGKIGDQHWSEVISVLTGGTLANNASVMQREDRWTISGDPTEAALVVAAKKAGLDKAELERRFPRVRENPFSSDRKMMSTIHESGDGTGARVLWSKGAPDVLLQHCSFEWHQGQQVRELTEARRAELLRLNAALTGEALRTLGVASRTLPTDLDWQHAEASELERELTFCGLVGMIDPPRPEAYEAVKKCKEAGIRPIMITGDHPGTALTIARELGIAQGDHVLAGAELEQMDENALLAKVTEVSVYARVNPEHKLRIVHALQKRGAIVAMTGDGAIFTNIRKFLRYLLSSNFGEVLTVFLGVVLGWVLGLRSGNELIMPLLATQILWINLMTDGPPALGLGVDPPEPHLMKMPPRPPTEHVITAEMLAAVALVGFVMAVGSLLVLEASLPAGFLPGDRGIEHGRTMAFTALVLFQLFNAYNSRSHRESAFKNWHPNPYLIYALLLSLVFQVVAVHTPFLQNALKITSLSWRDWGVCVLVSSSALWVMEIYKWVRRGRGSHWGGRTGKGLRLAGAHSSK